MVLNSTDSLPWAQRRRVLNNGAPNVLAFTDERVELHLRLREPNCTETKLGRYDLDLVTLSDEEYAAEKQNNHRREYSIRLHHADGQWLLGPDDHAEMLSDFAADPENYDLDERQFEAAVVEVFWNQFPPDRFRVEPTGDAKHHVPGRLSGRPR